jgi:hypothetical protein
MKPPAPVTKIFLLCQFTAFPFRRYISGLKHRLILKMPFHSRLPFGMALAFSIVLCVLFIVFGRAVNNIRLHLIQDHAPKLVAGLFQIFLAAKKYGFFGFSSGDTK